jgi:hypothetical protein
MVRLKPDTTCNFERAHMIANTAASPRVTARIAGVFYLLNIVTGALALVFVSGRSEAISIATVCYVVVTLVFYDLFKPVNSRLSLIAAVLSLTGCVVGILNAFHLVADQINLVFFGFYCLVIGYLILRSTFLPKILGVLMAIGGLGWVTFLAPPLANYLSPFNMFPGILGETVLTFWLLAFGVNAQRWKEQAAAVRSS